MRVLADGRALRHRLDHVGAEVLRMRAREAEALDAVDRVDRTQQLREVGAEVAPVRVHVLAEQRHFANAFAGERRDLGENFARPARDLAAAHRGHDAIGADGVAAHRDLDPGLEAALAVHRQRRRERALIARPPRPARHAVAARAEPLAEMRDRARAERDVDLRIEREDAVALRLREAAADGDDRVGVRSLARAGVAEIRGELRVGLLPDRARVEDDDVRLLRARSLAEAELLEHALDPLRIVGVHLAAERRDGVPLHGREG